jgi:hypothetical protein
MTFISLNFEEYIYNNIYPFANSKESLIVLKNILYCTLHYSLEHPKSEFNGRLNENCRSFYYQLIQYGLFFI